MEALRVLIINGPNLNMLGNRETGIYGKLSLADIEQMCQEKARELQQSLTFIQSNSEGDIVNAIHAAQSSHDCIIINAGAYTHTSIAIMDALLAVSLPVIEVHLSNIFKRESFRHESYISKVAHGVICGFGAKSYVLALEAVAAIDINS